METFDDRTKEKKAIIEIYNRDNLYFARIVESYVSYMNAVCETCTGTKKRDDHRNEYYWEPKKAGDFFNGGTILDPENGATYKCYLRLLSKTKLKERGYLGIALLGRTQYWRRKDWIFGS